MRESTNEVEGILVTFVTCNYCDKYQKIQLGSGFKLTNNYYALNLSTSYPHRSSHCRPQVCNDLRGVEGETPPFRNATGGASNALSSGPQP